MRLLEDELIIAGDVHGEATRLSRFFNHFSDPALKIILVGDYANRGPDSRGVLELLYREKTCRGDQLVLLRGNHEQALTSFLAGGSLADFAKHGGLATIRSYLEGTGNAVRDFHEGFPVRHASLLEEMRTYYATSTVLVSHAGFDTEYPLDFSRPALIHGDKRIFQHVGRWPRPTVVVGHYLQRSKQPLLSERLLAIDTGCGTVDGAPLTALQLPERRVFQF